MGFGEKLSSLRKQRGMTQVELAEKLSISRQAVSRWERGTAEPSTENLICIGRLFDVSVDDLMDKNSAPQNVPTEQVEDRVASVSQETKKRRFSLLHVFAVASCVLAVCVIVLLIVLVRLLTERDQQELESDLVPIIPIEDLNQEPMEDPENHNIVITYEEP